MTPERDRFIPVRKADILDALIDHGRIASAVERDQFRQLCRILTAIFHYDYFEQLEKWARQNSVIWTVRAQLLAMPAIQRKMEKEVLDALQGTAP